MADRRPSRFRVGETVRITGTIWSRFSGMTGVVKDVRLNVHSHTLDKYIVAFPSHPATTFWDIQLHRGEEEARSA